MFFFEDFVSEHPTLGTKRKLNECICQVLVMPDILLNGANICRELDMAFCFIFMVEVAFRIYIERWNFPKDWNCHEGGKVW